MSSVAHIALVPRGVKVNMSEVASVAAAISIQIVRDFGPIWGVTATVSAFPKPADVPVGFWPIYIEDTQKLPEGSTGLHLDKRNQPYVLLEAIEHWSMLASHECLELLVDPSGSRLRSGPLLEEAVELGLAQHQVQYVVEICDPVADGQYGYQINGVLLSDFFTPSYYDPTPSPGVRYDFVGALSAPMKVVDNGCLSWLDPVTGDIMQLQNFMGPDLRLHPQVVDLSNSRMFQDVSSKRPLRAAIDRVTVTPDFLAAMSREQHMSFETRYRAVRHASQVHSKRMTEEITASLEEHEQLLGTCLV